MRSGEYRGWQPYERWRHYPCTNRRHPCSWLVRGRTGAPREGPDPMEPARAAAPTVAVRHRAPAAARCRAPWRRRLEMARRTALLEARRTAPVARRSAPGALRDVAPEGQERAGGAPACYTHEPGPSTGSGPRPKARWPAAGEAGHPGHCLCDRDAHHGGDQRRQVGVAAPERNPRAVAGTARRRPPEEGTATRRTPVEPAGAGRRGRSRR